MAAANKSGDGAGCGAGWLGIAQLDLAEGKYQQSEASATRATAAFSKAAQNPETKNQRARALTTRGQARFFSGGSARALEDFEAALTIAKSTGDQESVVTRLNNIGNVHYGLGRYGDAYLAYQQALSVLQVNRQATWFASRMQLTNTNRAVLEQRLGHHQQALEIYRETAAKGAALPPAEFAQLLSNMGTVYRRLGDAPAAMEQYRKARDLFHDNRLVAGEIGVLTNTGIAQSLDLRDPVTGARTFALALEMAEKAGSKRLAMTARLYRGEALLRSGKPEAAEADFTQAWTVAGELGAREEQWRAAYGVARCRDSRGDLAASDHWLQSAMQDIQQLRTAAGGRSAVRTGFLTDRREVFDLALEHLIQDPAVTAEKVLTVMERSRARGVPNPPSIAELQVRLREPDMLIAFWRGRTKIAVVWVSKTTQGLVTREMANGLSTVDFANSDGPWREDSKRLWSLLLEAVPLPSTNNGHLWIAPDGALSLIPFEALLDSGGHYLAERYMTSYLPNVGALPDPATRERSRWRLTWPWKPMLRALADPTPGGGVAMSTVALPGAREESQEASKALDGRSSIWTGTEATKSRLAGESIKEAVVHLAAHAVADAEDPDRSYIELADGPLYAREAAALRMGEVSLVTISACESGVGVLAAGDTAPGFGASMLDAGAKAVVTSLWRAGDRSSADFMRLFYGHLAKGESVAEALRNTRLAFIAKGLPPKYWALFTVTGNGEIELPRPVPWWLVLVVGGAAVGGIYVLLKARDRKRSERGQEGRR